MTKISSSLHIVFAVLFWLLPLCATANDITTGEGNRRFIVRFDKPSLTKASTDGSVRIKRLPGGRLDFQSPTALAYRSVLERMHENFAVGLSALNPHAKIEYDFYVLFNGVVVRGASRTDLEQLRGVKRVFDTDTRLSVPSLDVSLDNVMAPDLWEALGGVEKAGEGIKVALIDSGIDINNPFFDPTDFKMPDGYPRGETAFTTAKVIVARAYFRADDPVNTKKDEMTPIDHDSHGSHCGGIIAGNYGTVFNVKRVDLLVSGVAPRAHLMAYKVFYHSKSDVRGAMDSELMAAFEDAVFDGADVISCSWGGADNLIDDTPTTEVYLAAIDAGAIVVFAAGNDGAGPDTISYPGSIERVITVGAYDAGRDFSGVVNIDSPTAVPTSLQKIHSIKGACSPDFLGAPVENLPIISAITAGGGNSDNGCNPFLQDAFKESIALMVRGECYFTDKIKNAYDAGAKAVIIFNDKENSPPFPMGGDLVPIPSVMLGNNEGKALETWVLENPGTTASLFDVKDPYIDKYKLEKPAVFTSRGPTYAPLLKPDISAPGMNVLSANAYPLGETGSPGGMKSGTSMAAPHVAGAAALLKQLRPTATHDQIKALLVGSARQDFLSKNNTTALDVGAGYMDLKAASRASAIASPPVISFGEIHLADHLKTQIVLQDLDDGSSYWTVKWQHDDAEFTPEVVPADDASVEVPSDLTVSLGGLLAAAPGEHTGKLLLKNNDKTLTIPYHYRVVPDRNMDLLLLDMSYLSDKDTSLVDFYRGLADVAGYSYDVLKVSEEKDEPLLENLSRYKTVLVFTGDDQSEFKRLRGTFTMNALSAYAMGGGSIIVAGQGALRGSSHKRLPSILGAQIDSDRLLWDADTKSLIKRDDYLIYPIDEITGNMFGSFDYPLDLAPDAGGKGDLSLLGVISQLMLGPGLPEAWTQLFLQIKGDPFLAGRNFTAAMFDSFAGYEKYKEVESLKYRAVLLGFGLERIGTLADETMDRQTFFEELISWVSERIVLTVKYKAKDRRVNFNAIFDGAEPVFVEYDFGDGTEPLATLEVPVYHEYDSYGEKQIVVRAKAPLGAVDIKRFSVMVKPEDTDTDTGTNTDTDIDTGSTDLPSVYVSDDMRIRDCACSEAGSLSFRSVLWLLGVLF